MNIAEAKELDIISYLSDLGFNPIKVTRTNTFWYYSPLRSEKIASFKVNKSLNRWFDFGIGKGGNLVDFGILYHQCSIAAFLQLLIDRMPVARSQQLKAEPTENRIKFIAEHSITSFELIRYLKERRISLATATTHLSQVTYILNGRSFYSLGFKNNSGGWELRNRYSKLSSSPKDSTFIENRGKMLAVFEGFFDFLSYLEMTSKQTSGPKNFLVLNSTAFFEKNIPLMLRHRHVHLFLDNDQAGHRLTNFATTLDCQKFSDERMLYANYKDLNDWTVNIGKKVRQQWSR